MAVNLALAILMMQPNSQSFSSHLMIVVFVIKVYKDLSLWLL